MNKKILLIPFFVTILLMVPLVQALPVYIIDFSAATYQDNYNSALGGGNSYGVAFAPAAPVWLTGVTFWFQREAGVTTATAHVSLVPGTGTPNTDAIGNSAEAQLAQTPSANLMTALPDTLAYYPVTFNFSSAIHLNPDLVYVLMINITAFAGSYLKLGVDQTDPANTYCNSVIWNGATYASTDTYDICTLILGDTASNAPVETTPIGGTAEGTWDTFAAIIPPLALFMIPALLLGYIGKWNLWLIMIGLTIGAGLCVLFLGAAYVWLVFSVIIGIVALAWRGH